MIRTDTRKIAAEYRLAQWSQAMQAKAASGESIAEFCENRGISRNTYFYWQRKLREGACQKLATMNVKAPVPNGWAVCDATVPVGEESALSIEVGRCRVSVGADVASETLEKVLSVLMRLC